MKYRYLLTGIFGETASEIQLDSSPFFSRPGRLFALTFGTEVRAGTHSHWLRRLSRLKDYMYVMNIVH